MTDLSEERKIEQLEDILLSYAHTIEEKIIVTNMANNNASVKDYVLALADGLRYGNWPWTTYSKLPKTLGDVPVEIVSPIDPRD